MDRTSLPCASKKRTRAEPARLVTNVRTPCDVSGSNRNDEESAPPVPKTLRVKLATKCAPKVRSPSIDTVTVFDPEGRLLKSRRKLSFEKHASISSTPFWFASDATEVLP